MKIVLLILVCCTIHAVFSRSLELCSGDQSSYKKMDDEVVKGNLFQPLKVRFPENGQYSNPITCIMAIDQTHTHSDPTITDGGIGDNYVEITIGPWLLEELKYRFQIYTS